ncbi:MAG TPA: DUF89 family protein [Firmicutes bacterium]|nr:DUF89 family protein [Bacillota bacterium]
MFYQLDCLPCLFGLALRAARAATDDEEIQRQVLNSIAESIARFPPDLKPPELSQRGFRLITEISQNDDPFIKEKAESNRQALKAYPLMKRLVEKAEDQFFTACKLAIVGNSFDLGMDFEHGGMDKVLEDAISYSLTINDYDKFKSALMKCESLLYLGDNAGEIVFDRLLIEEIAKFSDGHIHFAVRGKPVINDATMEDALSVGMDKVATVISNGSDAPGTILPECSDEFMEVYQAADVIIAKGQGNYESLEGEPGNIFFFLRAKCPIVAELIGVNVGDFILKQGG